MMRTLVLWSAMMAIAASSAWAADAVTGTISLPAGAALPPEAKIELVVLDEFAADAPTVVGHAEMKPATTPAPFTVAVDGQRIQGNHPYTVSAYVRSQGNLLFTVDKKYPVLTQGAPTKANIALVAAPAGIAAKPYGPAVEDNYWKLASIGQAAPPASGREAYLRLYSFAGNASASGGCNTFRGSYVVKDQSISFNGMASTRMACRAGTHVDEALMQALTAARTWKVTGDRLELIDAGGLPLAAFQAIPPR